MSTPARVVFSNPTQTLGDDPVSRLVSQLSITVNAFGHQHDDPNAACSDRVIGDLELIFFAGGLGTVTIDGRRFACRRGDLVVVPPYTVHSICADPEQPHDNYYLHIDVFPPYLRDPIVRSISNSAGPTKSAAPDMPACLEVLRRMETEYENPRAGGRAIVESSARVLLLLVARARIRTFGELPTPSERSVLDKAIAFLEERIAERVVVDALASECGTSKSVLFRVFRRHLGVPPIEFQRFLRLRRAELMLRTTDLPVKAISGTLGFSSQFHFSELFKERYGASPSGFRETAGS